MYVVECSLRQFKVDDIGAAKFLVGFFLRHGVKEVSVSVQEENEERKG